MTNCSIYGINCKIQGMNCIAFIRFQNKISLDADLPTSRLIQFRFYIDYLYMNLLILILGVFSNGCSINSTRLILLYAGIDLFTSVAIVAL